MTIKVRIGAAWKNVDPANIFRVRVGGVWKDVNKVWVRKTYGPAGAATVGWRLAWEKAVPEPTPPPDPPTPEPPEPPPVVLSISFSVPSVSGSRTDPGTVLTNTVTATVSGGTPPYTYQWIVKSFTNPIVPTISTPASATTRFGQVMQDYNSMDSASFELNVTDSLGNVGKKSIYGYFYVTQPPGGLP